MADLVLNADLKPVEFNPRLYPTVSGKAAVAGWCLSPDAKHWDSTSRTTTWLETVVASSVPETAAIYHKNYLSYLAHTFSCHHSIVLAPQHFWYTILCEIAQIVVRSPNTYRKLFTRNPEGKADLAVSCMNETEPLRVAELYRKLQPLIPVDSELFLPQFSTETEMSRVASLAAFMEVCSPYYNYMMYACGHPRVKLAGTVEDWMTITYRVLDLQRMFAACREHTIAPWLETTVLPVAKLLLQTAQGEQLSAWFKGIFTEERCGSGGQTQIDGWFSRLFLNPPVLRTGNNFASHITKVPYTTSPSGTQWNMCFGLFHSNLDAEGFAIPEFSWVQVRKRGEETLL